jgi:hypothetical protein
MEFTALEPWVARRRSWQRWLQRLQDFAAHIRQAIIRTCFPSHG